MLKWACFRKLFTLCGIGRLEGWKDGWQSLPRSIGGFIFHSSSLPSFHVKCKLIFFSNLKYAHIF